MSPLTIELDQALELIVKKTSGPQDIRIVGDHPKTGEPLVLKEGRYGPYISDGKVNASLPKDSSVESLSLEEAVQIIDKKRAAPKKKKKRKAKKK